MKRDSRPREIRSVNWRRGRREGMSDLKQTGTYRWCGWVFKHVPNSIFFEDQEYIIDDHKKIGGKEWEREKARDYIVFLLNGVINIKGSIDI